MKYKILSQKGHSYANEEGGEGERRAHLTGLERRLGIAIKAAESFEASHQGPQVASNLPAIGGGRVAALAAFHMQQQKNTTMLDALNADIIWVRQWIFRQGAVLTPSGKIVWHKSARTVEYDKDMARRNLTRVEFRGGLMYVGGKLLDTSRMVTAFSGPGHGIYVMSREGHIHVSPHAVGYRHHSSLLAGEDVAGAGELKVMGGRLLWISNKSGHYKPDLFLLLETLHELQESGVPMVFQVSAFSGAGRANYPSVEAFMRANGFDNETWEWHQILYTYEKYLTPAFFQANSIAFGVIGEKPGIYDMSSTPPRRVPLSEFEAKMHGGGMEPEPIHASGAGR